MNTSPEYIDNLIASYLAGEAAPEDRAFVDKWKEESEANRKYFDQMAIIFRQAAAVAVTESFSVDEAWVKLRSKLPPRGRRVTMAPEGQAPYPFFRIAAGVLLFIAAGVFAYKYFGDINNASIRVVAVEQTKADTLPDGSEVFLNRQTEIDFSFDQTANAHIARLDGEAYFNINHDDDRTFVVEAGGTFIRDIGTSFNVMAYPGSATVEVFVEEGEVMFYTKGNPGINVKADGRGIYNKETREFTIADPEPNATSYKTKSFTFSNHSLETVVETLNNVYATEIRIDDRLKNCRLTVSFNNESIEEIAGVIGETLGLMVSKEGDAIRLKGSGCGEGHAE